jgi:hypothetical protein
MTDSADLLPALPPDDPTRRMIAALADPDATFDHDQVQWLIAEAMRLGQEIGDEQGYQRRIDEENAGYPPPPLMFMGKWFDAAEYRKRWDAEAGKPRPNDHPGGWRRAEVWDADPGWRRVQVRDQWGRKVYAWQR